MMATEQTFIPRWASAPGDTIRNIIDSQGVSPAQVESSCGLKEGELEGLLQGTVHIDQPLAESLSNCLGGSTTFWIRREQRFREQEALVEADRWVETLPLKSMNRLSWLEVPRDWQERIEACLKFFGTDTLDAWRQSYSDQLQTVKFRTSTSFQNQVPSVSTWLRAGELANVGFNGGPLDRVSLSNSIPDLRELTRCPDPEIFLPAIQAILHRSGVSCIVVPTPEGCAASGASRVLQDGSALIQLSGRFLSDDQFWFSLFHEIGHLLLHNEAPLHIDGDPGDFEQDEMEREANSFAANVLWPFAERSDAELGDRPSRRDIVRLASRLGTSPGVVLGQLQSSGVLHYSEFNNLKRRYVRDGSCLLLKR
ncbi:ImmA/IrrE family metallo-endopeptidase [Arthrobacter sp. D5-1]|uniref:ImmA/IrrE family metallo-endopeptidase n=1 Tax=Arthrobacter sp. D5-1 TaxID=1477518 RepID=UPI001A99780A|nr:ImmA/IrrE family metallo-endopeptidase [Arthrobacter sp. D5-1]